MNLDKRILDILDEELKDSPTLKTELLRSLAKDCPGSMLPGESVLDALLNNFHGNVPKGFRWESMMSGRHDHSGILKDGTRVPYSTVFCRDVLAIIKDFHTRDIIPDEYWDYRSRYQGPEKSFEMRLIDFRIYCRLCLLGYDELTG